MLHLSIADYDKTEQQARLSASYGALRAFAPVSFSEASFPTRVTEEQELRRYADTMYEFFVREDVMESADYSESEAKAILRVSRQIRELTQTSFGRVVQPLMCLFQPIPILRAVEAIAAVRGRRLKIFEIGLGSGYLGAYLLNAGHAYSSMDITQALYLWQNRLLSSIAPRTAEWALNETGDPAYAHVPWWRFARFHEELLIEADVVICDAALGEMETFGLRYNLRTARAMLSNSDCAAFIFRGYGEERQTTRPTIDAWIAGAGFRGRAIEGVSVLSVGRRLDDVFRRDLETLPRLGDAAEKRVAPSSFLKIDDAELLESYAFFGYIQDVSPRRRKARGAVSADQGKGRALEVDLASASTPHAAVEAMPEGAPGLRLSAVGGESEHYAALSLPDVDQGTYTLVLDVRPEAGARIRVQALEDGAFGIIADFNLAAGSGGWHILGGGEPSRFDAAIEAGQDGWSTLAVKFSLEVRGVTLILQLLSSYDAGGFTPAGEQVFIRSARLLKTPAVASAKQHEPVENG